MTKLAVIFEVTVTLGEINVTTFLYDQCRAQYNAVLTFNIQCLQGIFLLPITPFFMLSWYDPLEDPDIALGLTLAIALHYIFIFCVKYFLE